MTRFWNLIVHDYARIDDASVYGILIKRVGDVARFAAAVKEYMAS